MMHWQHLCGHQLVGWARVADPFMEKRCARKVHGTMKYILADLQALASEHRSQHASGVGRRAYIGFMDCHKWGRVGDGELDAIATWCQAVCNINPSKVCVLLVIPTLSAQMRLHEDRAERARFDNNTNSWCRCAWSTCTRGAVRWAARRW